MKIIDLFSGIGGFIKGLEQAEYELYRCKLVYIYQKFLIYKVND